MRLTLVRHGPTEWNATRRFQGRTNLPLSEQGRNHARAIAHALENEPIERIYTSGLVRALQTAQAIAEKHRVEIVTDDRLAEFDFGAWEGLSWDEIVATRPHLSGRGSTAVKLYTPEGGESYAQVRARVRHFIEDLARRHEENLVAVTHAGPLHAMLDALNLEDDASPSDRLSLRFTPGGITRIALEDGRASILSLNDVAHLDGTV